MFVCFLTKVPHPSTVSFASLLAFHGYRVFIMIDDDNFHVQAKKDITFVKVNAKECEAKGFKSSTSYAVQRAIARDKAHYYFSTICTEFSHLWLIEDDVFIPSQNTLKDLDQACGNVDLVIPHHFMKNDKDTSTWRWRLIFDVNKAAFPLPYGYSMMCAARFSKRMVQSISSYAQEYKNTFFAESMYNTLAIHHGFTVCTPPQMHTIVFRHDWVSKPLKPDHLYHPVKDFSMHDTLRERILKNKDVRDSEEQ